MGSAIRAPYDIEKAALEIARKKPRFNDVVPERFINYLNDYRERRNTRSVSIQVPLSHSKTR